MASGWLVAMGFFVVAPQTGVAAVGFAGCSGEPDLGSGGRRHSHSWGHRDTLGADEPRSTNTVRFTLYSDSTCTPVLGVTGTANPDQHGTPSPIRPAYFTTDWTPRTALDTYYWQASYSDPDNGTATSVCSDSEQYRQPGDRRPGIADADDGGDARDGGGRGRR